jgi:hypothetical protein
MTSTVFICNLALSNIGKDNIQALTDAGAEARACSQFYEHTRDILLQAYPWRFAGVTASLAEITNDKPGQWGHAYTIPNDCLKIRWVRKEYTEDEPAVSKQEEMSIPYEIEGRKLYCNLSPAFLRYTTRQVDPARYPALFVDALSWHLAVRLSMPLTRDPKVRADAWQVATQMTGQAQMADANDERETSDHATEFVTGRG